MRETFFSDHAIRQLPPSLGQLAAVYGALPEGENDAFDEDAVSYEGNDEAHPNMQPYLAVNYIIARVGVFPPRD